MMNRRLGSFFLARFMIEEEIDLVAEVFKMLEFVPLKVECSGIMDRYEYIEYIGISKWFDEVPKGNVAPTYDIRIIKGKDGFVESIEVVKGGENEGKHIIGHL